MTAGADFGSADMGSGDVLGQAELLVGFDNVDEMMRNGRLLLGRWLCGTDIHAPIEGHGIEGNNLGTNVSRECDADLRFSPRGRAGQKPAVFGSKIFH